MARITAPGRSTSLPPNPSFVQTNLDIEAVLKPVLDMLYTNADSTQLNEFAVLGREATIRKHFGELNVVTKEKNALAQKLGSSSKVLSTAEDKLRSAEDRAKGDRVEWVELRKKWSDEKKKAKELLEREKEESEKLFAKLKAMEEERQEMESAHKTAIELGIGNTELKGTLEKSKTDRQLLLLNLEQSKNENVDLKRRNSAFSADNHTLLANNIKLEGGMRHLREQMRLVNNQRGEELQNYEHNIASRDATIQQLRNVEKKWAQIKQFVTRNDEPPSKRARIDQAYGMQPDASYSVQMPVTQPPNGLSSPVGYGPARHQSYPPATVSYVLNLVMEYCPQLIKSGTNSRFLKGRFRQVQAPSS
jgi:hypothetical protein